jgi:Uma2 family endonuclease
MPVNVSKPVNMTADEFIAWGLRQDSGRYELDGGEVVVMAPERTEHVRLKGEIYVALRQAAERAEAECEVFTDGVAVEIDERTVFEPDASVRIGERLPGGVARISDPAIVVEVLSPSTAKRDLATKLAGYFRLPAVRHYLILDPDESMLIHHARQRDGSIATATLTAGTLRLEPPGLSLDIGTLFGGSESGTQNEPLRTGTTAQPRG